MERIVVGIDESAGRLALEWAIRRSIDRPTEVHLVRALDLLAGDPIAENRLLGDAADEVRRRSPHTVVRASLVIRSIPHALLAAAADADLLVIGSHARRPLASALTGSVPLAVAAKSSCATVIVPDGWTPGLERTIVAGVAGDGTSDRAVLFAAQEALTSDAELEIVHAWTINVPTLASPDLVLDEAEDRARHRAVLTAALDRIRRACPGVRARAVLEQRLPSIALAGHAARGRLLVLGSHRWGPVTGMLLGSTARAVLREATEPVCIVPPASPGDRAPSRPEREEIGV